MIEILGFYRGHYDLLWVRFRENGRNKLSNGFFIRDETPSSLKMLWKVKKFSANGLIARLGQFYPDHELTKTLRSMKLT